MTNPTIVVVAYNRTASLQKLLNSLSQAEYSEDEVNLIISIDYSGDNKIYKAADAFQWQFGHKKIIRHNTN
jgi:glycosyltransferase involved in cell wall biosynthesis